MQRSLWGEGAAKRRVRGENLEESCPHPAIRAVLLPGRRTRLLVVLVSRCGCAEDADGVGERHHSVRSKKAIIASTLGRRGDWEPNRQKIVRDRPAASLAWRWQRAHRSWRDNPESPREYRLEWSLYASPYAARNSVDPFRNAS